jgi:peptidoglycan/LPS O-acetylase OafA/YrhL
VLLARRRGRGTLALLFAVALWVFGQFANPAVSVWVVSYAPIFLGCAVAMFVHHPSGYLIVRNAARPYVLYPMILTLAVLVAFRLPSLGEAVKQILAAGVLVGVVLERRGIASSTLTWSPLGRIGVLSYALYLFHSLVLLREADSAIRPRAGEQIFDTRDGGDRGRPGGQRPRRQQVSGSAHQHVDELEVHI